MTSAIWPLQQAVYAKVTAAPAFTAVAKLHDEVPENDPGPYVTFGASNEVQEDAHDQRGLAVNLVLDIWSRYRGWREAAQILTALDTVLDRQPLAVPGFKDVSIAHTQHTQLRDPDPDIRHISVTYRVWMTKQ